MYQRLRIYILQGDGGCPDVVVALAEVDALLVAEVLDALQGEGIALCEGAEGGGEGGPRYGGWI